MTEVALTFPKFKHAPDPVSFKELLRELGAPDAFDPARADFSEITRSEPLVMHDVVQQAFIDVDEQGTEAAAATAVIGIDLSVPSSIVPLAFNWPFFFVIRDNATSPIVFAGRVMCP